jgi:uncharacterized membrane protein
MENVWFAMYFVCVRKEPCSLMLAISKAFGLDFGVFFNLLLTISMFIWVVGVGFLWVEILGVFMTWMKNLVIARDDEENALKREKHEVKREMECWRRRMSRET